MATVNSTKTQLDAETISQLQRIRRANEGVYACVSLLKEGSMNKDCEPGVPRAFIAFDAGIAAGLEFAIEACAEQIKDIFDDKFEKLGVAWQDPWMPEIESDAKARADLAAGAIDFSEYERRCGGGQ